MPEPDGQWPAHELAALRNQVAGALAAARGAAIRAEAAADQQLANAQTALSIAECSRCYGLDAIVHNDPGPDGSCTCRRRCGRPACEQPAPDVMVVPDHGP